MKIVYGLLLVSCNVLSVKAADVAGVVVDSSTKEPLIGATVQLAGSQVGTATDIDGKFSLNADDGNLIVKYVSYKDKTVSVLWLKAGNDTITLVPDNTVLGELTVTARARQDSEATVVEKTKNSMTVQNGVSSQQIKKTQDKDASEVIKRVPGISIIDDKFVMVRGLSQRYNNVWINGSAVPSSEADSRAFSFDLIPSSQLDNIMIVKSPSPELPADFSGGFILVNTRNLPEENSSSVSIGGNINDRTHFRDFLSIKGSKTDFLGFDNGFRSLNGGMNGSLQPAAGGRGVNLLGNGFNNDWRVKESTPYSDLSLGANTNYQWHTADDHRIGLLGAINYSYSYRTLENMTNSLFGAYDVEHDRSNYLRNSTDDQYTENARVGAMLNLTFVPDGNKGRYELKNIFNQIGKNRYTQRHGFNAQSEMEQSAEYYYSSRTIFNTQFTGENTIKGKNELNWNIGYAYANKNTPDRRRYTLTNAMDPDRIGLVTGNDIQREFTFLKEHIASAGLNYSRDFEIGKIKPTVKAGGYGEYRSRDYRTRAFYYNWDVQSNNLPDDFRYMSMQELLSNEAYYGDDMLYLFEEMRWRDSYKGNNTLLASYLAFNIQVGKLNVYAGVRFEHSRMELISNSSDYEESPYSRFYDYNDFFPTVNTVYKFTDKQQMRLAYGKSVNRQEFREVSGSVYYDFDLASNVQGNADLKPCYIHNLDLRYEFYPSAGELISVAAFFKKFNDPIEWSYRVQGGTDLLYYYKNAKGAISYGIEVDIKKSLDFIGLDDFSLLFNGSLIKSEVSFNPGDLESDRPMQGQSPYLINTGIFYQNERAAVSASILYNRIGKRLVGVGREMGMMEGESVKIPDSYEMPRNQIDLNVSKKFGKGFEIKLSVRDLLGEKVSFKQFDDITRKDGTTVTVEEVTKQFRPGRNFNLSLSYDF